MAPRLRFNEGKACDAILRRLEAREGARRTNLRSPERERHPAPVELACEIGDRLFAIEHTGIEPFPGHMQLEAEAGVNFRPIEAMVAGRLPAPAQRAFRAAHAGKGDPGIEGQRPPARSRDYRIVDHCDRADIAESPASASM
jgi:hypothetical protein